LYDNFPKRQSIKGDVREYGKKHIRKYFGRMHRKSTRNRLRSYG
jgi:hypothetical protein